MYVKDMDFIHQMLLKDIKQNVLLKSLPMIVELHQENCFKKELINKNGQKKKVLKKFLHI